ncbi:MAG: class I SAM-dependent methyltransferase [Pirellulales bacterium]|nr:class I SAM-dependent methyltransferase [Pirellulales bacterium]
MSKHEQLEKEVAFHDAIAERIAVDDERAKRFFAFDTPAGYYANQLPRLRQTLLQALGNPSEKRVLVYGCGNDSAAIWFSKSGAKVDAIDISPKSVENQQLLADLLGLRINAVVMDAHNLDLPSDQYNIVYGNAILHHLDLQDASPEIARVLKPGGKAVFRDVMSGNVFLRAFRFATPFWRTPDEHPLTSSDLALLAQEFSECRNTEYILSGLPFFFFARIMNDVILKRLGLRLQIPLPRSVYANLDRLDEVLFRLVPFLKNQAWLCLIVLTKESKAECGSKSRR